MPPKLSVLYSLVKCRTCSFIWRGMEHFLEFSSGEIWHFSDDANNDGELLNISIFLKLFNDLVLLLMCFCLILLHVPVPRLLMSQMSENICLLNTDFIWDLYWNHFLGTQRAMRLIFMFLLTCAMWTICTCLTQLILSGLVFWMLVILAVTSMLFSALLIIIFSNNLSVILGTTLCVPLSSQAFISSSHMSRRRSSSVSVLSLSTMSSQTIPAQLGCQIRWDHFNTETQIQGESLSWLHKGRVPLLSLIPDCRILQPPRLEFVNLELMILQNLT